MKKAFTVPLFAVLTVCIPLSAQDGGKPITNALAVADSKKAAGLPGQDASSRSNSIDLHPAAPTKPVLNARDKFQRYIKATYVNPGALIEPAIQAGIRMANPPGKGATEYPREWRQGDEALGRNYGDAVARRVSFQTARLLTGAMVREDPRYKPSASHNPIGRSWHAMAFTFVDRSDSGHWMPAMSNFVGAAAGGFVGNAYLPSGFDDVTHAGQR